MKEYVVIDSRNGFYSVAGRSKTKGVDYADALGGMGLEQARGLADKLNACGPPMEPEVDQAE